MSDKSNIPDRKETLKYLEDMQDDTNITPYQVLNTNYIEQQIAVLNYSPILKVRQLAKPCKKPKEEEKEEEPSTEPVKEEVWVGTYIEVSQESIHYTKRYTDRTIANPIEHLEIRYRDSYGDEYEESGLDMLQGEVLFSTVDVDSTIYNVISNAEHIITDFRKDNEILTAQILKQGIQAKFIPDIDGSSTKNYRDYHNYLSSSNTLYGIPQYKPLNSDYTSYVVFNNYQGKDIRINNLSATEFVDENIKVHTSANKLIIYGLQSFDRDKFVHITANSIEEIYADHIYPNTWGNDVYVRIVGIQYEYVLEPYIDNSNSIPPHTQNQSPDNKNPACNHDNKRHYFNHLFEDRDGRIDLTPERVQKWYNSKSLEEKQQLAQAFAVTYTEQDYTVTPRAIYQKMHTESFKDINFKPYFDDWLEFTVRTGSGIPTHAPYSQGNKFDEVTGNPCEKGYYRNILGMCAIDYSYCNPYSEIPFVLLGNLSSILYNAHKNNDAEYINDLFGFELHYKGNAIFTYVLYRKLNPEIRFEKDITVVATDLMDYILFRHKDLNNSVSAIRNYNAEWLNSFKLAVGENTVINNHETARVDYVDKEADVQYKLDKIIGLTYGRSLGVQYRYRENSGFAWATTADEACRNIVRQHQSNPELWDAKANSWNIDEHNQRNTTCTITKSPYPDNIGNTTIKTVTETVRVETQKISCIKLFNSIIANVDNGTDTYAKTALTHIAKQLLSNWDFSNKQIESFQEMFHALNRGYL